jgi:hypothetical protein
MIPLSARHCLNSAQKQTKFNRVNTAHWKDPWHLLQLTWNCISGTHQFRNKTDINISLLWLIFENTSQLKFRNNAKLFVLEMRETHTWKHDEGLFRGYLAKLWRSLSTISNQANSSLPPRTRWDIWIINVCSVLRAVTDSFAVNDLYLTRTPRGPCHLFLVAIIHRTVLSTKELPAQQNQTDWNQAIKLIWWYRISGPGAFAP